MLRYKIFGKTMDKIYGKKIVEKWQRLPRSILYKGRQGANEKQTRLSSEPEIGKKG